MKKKGGAIKTVIICLCFGAAAFIFLLTAAQKASGEYAREEMAVAIARIPEGTEITKENIDTYFETRNLSAELLTGQSVTDVSALIGKRACRTISGMELVHKGDFTKEDDTRPSFKDPVEVSIALAAFSDGVSGTIRKGDLINIYGIDDQTGEIAYTLENVYVSGSFDSSGIQIQPGDNASTAVAFNVLLESGVDKEMYAGIENREVKVVKRNK